LVPASCRVLLSYVRPTWSVTKHSSDERALIIMRSVVELCAARVERHHSTHPMLMLIDGIGDVGETREVRCQLWVPALCFWLYRVAEWRSPLDLSPRSGPSEVDQDGGHALAHSNARRKVSSTLVLGRWPTHSIRTATPRSQRCLRSVRHTRTERPLLKVCVIEWVRAGCL
jgi:hypothetical protein